ncbi:hypothetical protein ACAW74_24245 [Fibrella sp. WM1]|uniref:hypothetical protein n=1 Tax=Fibrella musci TaxID=3242485 RepID=UPI003520BCF6
MKRQWIASLALGLFLSTAALAQTQPSGAGNTAKSGQRNTSSTEGLQRKGGEQVGTRGSEKMKDGVSRSGNSNLSPTSPTNVSPPGGDKKNASGGGTAANNTPTSGAASTGNKAEKPNIPVQKPVKSASGTRNGNVGNAGTKPVQTQGSTSDGSGSVASNGGAPGTRTKETRSVKPKSRAAAMDANDKSQPASAAGQASSAQKTGANGAPSQGGSNLSLTKQGQKEGSASDAAKRNKPTPGAAKTSNRR